MKLILQRALTDDSDETFIVCNAGKKKVKKSEYINELHRYKSKCSQCKTIVHKVRSLLDEFKIIKENEIFGICTRCKQSCKTKCPRCDYIKNKFFEIYERSRKERQKRFKIWLCKVKQLLQSILDEEEICQQGVHKDIELEKLLQGLKEPLDVRQPDIDFFPDFENELSSMRGLQDSKILLEELLSKMKPEAEESSAHLSTSKDLKEKQLKEVTSGLVELPHEGSQATILTGVPTKHLARSPSQEQCRDLVKRLIMLSQDLPRGMHLNKELIQDLIETIDTATKRGLTVNIVNKLINQLRELDKCLDYNLSKELDKHVIIGLIDDLNNLLTVGSSPTINKGLLKLLTQLNKLLTNEINKQHSSHLLLKSESSYKKYGIPDSEMDETHHELYPSQSKETPHKSFNGEGITRERIPRSVSEEIRYKEQSGIDHKMYGTYDEIPTKDVGPDSSKIEQKLNKSEKKITEVRGEESKVNIYDKNTPYSKSESKQLSPGKSKDKSKVEGLKTLQSDGIEERQPKSHVTIGTKRSMQAPGKAKSRFGKFKLPPIVGSQEIMPTQTDSEEMQPVVGKETEISTKTRSKKSLSKVQSKKMNKADDGGESLTKSISKASILSKRALAKKYALTKKDTDKTELARGKEDSLILTIDEIATLPDAVRSSSTDKITSLIQVLGNLNRALTLGVLNKKLFEHLVIDVHDILGETPINLLHKINKHLVQLCKPVEDGIPDDIKLKLVQELISSATKDLSQGLSEHENRATVKSFLHNLNKALMPVSKEWKTKHRHDTQKSRDLRYLSKAISKRIDDLCEHRLKFSHVTTSRASLTSGQEISKLMKGRTVYSLETAAALETVKKKKREVKPIHKAGKSVTSMKSSQHFKKLKQLSEAILGKILEYEKTDEEMIEKKKKAQEMKREATRLKEIEMDQQTRSLANISSRVYNLSAKQTKIMSPTSSTSSTLSVVEGKTCASPERKLKIPKVMIKGERIVPYDAEYMEHLRKEKRTILKIQHITDLPRQDEVEKEPEHPGNYDASADGILKYRLSNRQFIDKGWTILPTKKVMRRMNIYRMIPSQPQRDWFRLHRNRQLFYDTGDMLASVDSDGRGLWFYRTGPVALEYYDARESQVGQRYVVYSSGQEVDHGWVKPRTILALFDVQGNGVVYDHHGNVRLKYNQSEGVLVDPTLGPPNKWKWHTLNDPPILEHVFLNPQLQIRDNIIEDIGKTERPLDSNPVTRKIHPEVLAIELENFVREKTSKLTHKFKKLEIRMKAIKLNEHFSLKILDQTAIYLIFRDGTTSLKLNLGMVLISDEIVDTDTAELTDVQTPYDRLPAKSPSVEDIQLFLKTVHLRNQTLCATRT